MPTTVHIPKPLLAAADRRAKALKISRNSLIVDAIKRELGPATAWSPRFLGALQDVDADTAGAVDDLLTSVLADRRSKTPPRL